MPVLDSISIRVTDAIATHPSITKVCLGGRYSYGIETIVTKNKRITEYVINNYEILYPECGDEFTKATHIRVLVFRDSDLIKFVQNNTSLYECSFSVNYLDELVALKYTNTIRELTIRCMSGRMDKETRDVIESFYDRCRPKRFYVEGMWYRNRDTEAFCAIDHDALPCWNFKKADQISDAAVTCHDLP